MASHDVRDVLNLSADHLAGPRPSKKQKIAAARPNLKGLAREVQNLGGDNPIAIVPDITVFKKKKKFQNRKPAERWELRGFKNSAREDDGALVLRHWRRKTDGEQPPRGSSEDPDVEAPAENAGGDEDAPPKVEGLEDSSFAKFNVKVNLPEYDDDQYTTSLRDPDWTREETDYLMDLTRLFDLRWTLIWDRYDYVPKAPEGDSVGDASTAVIPAPKQRTMEDLKSRYYTIASKMMDVQKPSQYMTPSEFELWSIMKDFDPAREHARKNFAINSMSRSKDEAREEESLLLEIKRILARTERLNEERRELYQRLDYPHTDTDISSFKSSQGLQTLLQNLMNVDKSKKRRSLMGPEAVTPGGPNGQPGSAVSEMGSHRRESIAASVSGHRDSIATPVTPAEPSSSTLGPKKKGGPAAPPTERRKLSPQEEQVYGVSHHDRLSSGPTFRYEKINKLYSHKSGQQQLRITNVLNELDLPSRLTMPTASVTAQFEVLWAAVTALVDLRKTGDKIDAEVKIEEAKQAERAKAKGIAVGGQTDGAAGESKPGAGSGTKPGDSGTTGAPAAGGDASAAQANGDGTSAEAKAAGDGAETVPAPAASVKEEDGDKEKSARPGSSGAHKRSASVLSTTSDKSTKRQKK